jgi:hypothetical protein
MHIFNNSLRDSTSLEYLYEIHTQMIAIILIIDQEMSIKKLLFS